MITIELHSPNGPRVLYTSEHESDEIDAAIPAGWAADYSNQVTLYGGGYSAPLVSAPMPARVVITRVSHRPSRKVDDNGAMDAKLIVTIVTPTGHASVEIGTTLIPGHGGALDSWGELSNWLDAIGVGLVDTVVDAYARTFVQTIRDAAAHGGPESCNLEVKP